MAKSGKIHCEIKVIILCQVKIKIIKIIQNNWYWVTKICWCQPNPEIHCSPAMHNVWDSTKKILYKLLKLVNFWIMGELLNYWWTFELWVGGVVFNLSENLVVELPKPNTSTPCSLAATMTSAEGSKNVNYILTASLTGWTDLIAPSEVKWAYPV